MSQFFHRYSAQPILLGSALLALLAIAGCGKKSEPGGPGSVRFAGKGPVGPKLEDVFRLTVPNTPVKIVQGGDTDVNFGIERGATFDQEVVLNFADLPRGATFAPPQPVFRHSQSQVNVRFTAAKDTPLGTTTVKVVGNPMQGPEAFSLFKMTVEKPAQ